MPVVGLRVIIRLRVNPPPQRAAPAQPSPPARSTATATRSLERRPRRIPVTRDLVTRALRRLRASPLIHDAPPRCLLAAAPATLLCARTPAGAAASSALIGRACCSRKCTCTGRTYIFFAPNMPHSRLWQNSGLPGCLSARPPLLLNVRSPATMPTFSSLCATS